jgi:hypothetical protein
MSWRSFNERARRSIRVTASVSPARKKSSSTWKLGAAVAALATGLLGSHYLAARCLERGALDREILIEGRYPGVPVKRHERREMSR